MELFAKKGRALYHELPRNNVLLGAREGPPGPSPKSPEEQEKMRVAGRLAADVLDMIGEHVKPGVTTEELDRLCHDYIVQVQKAMPANVGYNGLPEDHLHLGQPRRLPWHPERQGWKPVTSSTST